MDIRALYMHALFVVSFDSCVRLLELRLHDTLLV